MNSPTFWKHLLESLVQAGHTQGHLAIAGGCVRDYLLGLEPKDIDIFVGTPLPNNARHNAFFAPTDWQPVPAPPNNLRAEYFGEGTNHIAAIHDFTVADTAVQMIYVNRFIFDHIARFDLQLSNGTFHLNEGLVVPMSLMKGISDKVIRANIRRTSNNTMARAERFLEKISAVEDGWTIDVDQINNNNLAQPAPQWGQAF